MLHVLHFIVNVADLILEWRRHYFKTKNLVKKQYKKFTIIMKKKMYFLVE